MSQHEKEGWMILGYLLFIAIAIPGTYALAFGNLLCWIPGWCR